MHNYRIVYRIANYDIQHRYDYRVIAFVQYRIEYRIEQPIATRLDSCRTVINMCAIQLPKAICKSNSTIFS